MEKVLKFLQDAKTYYLATMDEDGQPRVRPFASAAVVEGKLCICTSKGKKVYEQMKKNPKVGICAMNGDQ